MMKIPQAKIMCYWEYYLRNIDEKVALCNNSNE